MVSLIDPDSEAQQVTPTVNEYVPGATFAGTVPDTTLAVLGALVVPPAKPIQPGFPEIVQK